MKKHAFFFILITFAVANAKSVTVARIGISQPHIREQKLEKSSEKTWTFGIGKRYYPWEQSHFYWGFDIIHSQAKFITNDILFKENSPGFENQARIVHYDINYSNIEIPVLMGYNPIIFKKSFINIESGLLISLAYKTDGEYHSSGGINLNDTEAAKYDFIFPLEKYHEPNQISFNWLIAANFKYRFLGVDLQYRRALNKIGDIDVLPNQFIDSISVYLLFYF